MGSKNKMNLKKYIKLPDFRINISKLTRFLDRLASISSAGIPLLRALGILESQEQSKKFKSILKQISSKLHQGHAFADTLSLFGKSIPSSCINIIKAGELSGNLDLGLKRGAAYLAKQNSFRGKLLRSMMYPAFVICLSTLSLIFLFIYLLPMFSNIFGSLDTKLPLITILIIAFADFIGTYKLFILIFVSIMSFLFIYFTKKEKGAAIIDKAKLRLPIIGNITKKTNYSNISISLGEMLSSGVSILQALETTKDMTGSRVFKKALEVIREKVEGGERLFQAMAETGVFPEVLIHMIAAGEETGELAKMLKGAAEFYEEETEQSLKVLASFIEPIATVTAGVIVGIIVMAMFMPLISMVSALE